MITLKFLGHACFLLEDERFALLFDPFLRENPQRAAMPEDIERCTHILVSHGHGDHLGDAFEIAKKTGATVISTAEIAGLAGAEEIANHAMHIGGKFAFEFGAVRITPAFHGAGVPGGHACGFIVDFGGVNIYFAGDTSLFGDMALLGRLERIDYALLPIGDNFTMGPSDAAEAAAMLNARHVVPMHYNTWPVIRQSPEKFKAAVEKRCAGNVLILNPGEQISL